MGLKRLWYPYKGVDLLNEWWGYSVLPVPHPLLPQEHPDDALRIFAEDINEVESLPRNTVVEHLQANAPHLTMAYLVSTNCC